MDSAIHRLNVFQYNLDVKLSQLSDKVIRMDAKVGKIQDETESISRVNKENHREIGRLEGTVRPLTIYIPKICLTTSAESDNPVSNMGYCRIEMQTSATHANS